MKAEIIEDKQKLRAQIFKGKKNWAQNQWKQKQLKAQIIERKTIEDNNS